MKAYILQGRSRISPFGDPVGESMIGNRTLAAHQTMVLQRLGFEVERIASPSEISEREFVLCHEDVFFTRRAIRDLAARFRTERRSLRLGLPEGSLLVRSTRALQDLDQGRDGDTALALYRLFFLACPEPPRSDESLARAQAEAQPACGRYKEIAVEVPNPRHIMGSSAYRHPLTSSVAMHIRHWVHILWANQLSVQIQWVEDILDHKGWTGLRLLRAGMAGLFSGRWSRGGFRQAAMGSFNRIGKGCDIHPTAHLELARVGDNVRIGAFALVRGSIIGANTVIEDRVNLQYSVIGEGCHMSRNASMTLCAGYPGGNLSIRGVQASLFGRDCAMTSGGMVIDARFRGEIQVMTPEGPRSAGTNFLGACFGHKSYLGLDAAVNAGREVPNGAVLVRDPKSIFSKIPADLPPGVPAWAKDGAATTSN
jgi:carbonic anhydrase/acetyltransferase-like protein (isoleucine patch superfamily)